MRVSKLFTKTIKENPKDEVSVNAQLLIRAGFIDKLMSGAYTYLPLGLRVFKKIENIIRKEMEEIDGQEILMPSLHPKSNWETTGRWETEDNLFRFTSYYSKIEYALGSTHEEIISPLMKKFIFSYKDLPRYVFQIQNKFRDEKRAKSGILRGREFFMKDLYSFHADEKDLDDYYEKAKESYKRIFEKVGLGKTTYLTFASGGSFSKYSHEFQTLTPSGEDVIYLCEKCSIAINKEIIEDQNKCPECGSSDLKEKKSVEVGNVFKLKNKYSSPFDLKYKAADGSEKDVLMGCYGIGLGRLLGTIVEVYHDEKGIVWPLNTAPYRVHLLNLNPQNSDVLKNAEEIYADLQKREVEVLYDDRRDIGAGEKFAEADLIGIPLRVVVSEKTVKEGKFEVKKREEEKAYLISAEEFLKLI